MSIVPFTKQEMAIHVAKAIAPGSFVNLGIGLPELVANFISPDQQIVLHSENGLLGMGPTPVPGSEDWDLINAGKKPVTIVDGGSFFHHADSFAMIRGGHIDVCVMGAFQVSVNGDLANWDDGTPNAIPAVGGAMDLASGADKVFAMMTLFNRAGAAKLISALAIPVTATKIVRCLFTDYADFVLKSGEQPVVVKLAEGVTIKWLAEKTGVGLTDGRKRDL
jgi:3-oxoadipate CoA-transferase beta subunit